MGQMAGGEGPNQGSGEGPGGGNVFGNLLRGGLKGLGSGLQNYASQQDMIQNRGGGGMMQPAQGALPVDASYFQPQKRGPNNLAFYGGSY